MRRLIFSAASVAWLSSLSFATLAGGCVYRGAKLTEGTDLSIGLSVPASEGVAQMSVLNWLSGFRLAVAENAQLRVDYETAETNSYFGVVSTRTSKRVSATVEPCEIAAPSAAGE